MGSINNEQKQLLFDYAIGLTSEKESAEAEALISSNKEAAKIHSSFKAALSPLDSLEFEPCPDELVEGTIWRVNSLVNSGHLGLEHLLGNEQKLAATSKGSFWHNLSELATVAAVILLVTGFLFPLLSYGRQKAWQRRCEMQLGNIFQGLVNYTNDYDGKPPTVAMASGAPWWKVGYQGKENYSNTRNVWLLVKGGYVGPNNFICPGKQQGRAVKFDTCDVQNYNDFPDRKHITYSIRIRCPNSPCTFGTKPIMADSNPIFDGLEANSAELRIQLDDKLLIINSSNHNRRGQNVLSGDGSVKFTKGRCVGGANDDVFTLQQMRPGFEVKGCELPSCEEDAFLAP